MIFSEIFKTFLISGALVTFISYIANKSTKIGALLYSFPTQFLISIFIMYFSQESKYLIINFIKNTVFSIAGIIVFLTILFLITLKLNENEGEKNDL